MTPTLAVGLDVGTTYSSISIYENGRVQELSIPANGSQMPSVVFYATGKEPVVGSNASRAAFRDPAAYHTHFKRSMPVDPDTKKYGGRNAVELTSLVLKELITVLAKAHSESADCLSGKSPRDNLALVVSHPAGWGVNQRECIRKAAKLAGFEIDSFIAEPCAAARSVLREKQHRIRQNDLMLIVDFGGGTLDIVVVRNDCGTLHVVVPSSGDERLGGENITGELFKLVCKKLKLKYAACFDPDRGLDLSHQSLNSETKAQQAMTLWGLANDAKEQFSTGDTATIFFDRGKGPEEISITASEYERVTQSLMHRVKVAVEKSIVNSGFKWSDIQHAAAVGGSVMARGVIEQIARGSERSVQDILVSGSPSHVVANGAALSGIENEKTDSHVPRGLGLRLRDGNGGYTNKFFIETNRIINAGGEDFQDTGQAVKSKGGKTKIRLDFVEAKPTVDVPAPHPGVPTLITDMEVVKLDQVVHEVELPNGEHEALISISVENGELSNSLSFPGLDIETESGPITAGGAEYEETAEEGTDLFLLFDSSSSMMGLCIENAKLALNNLLDQVGGKNVRVCLACFGHETGLACKLGSPIDVVRKHVDSLKADGGTPMTEALNCVNDEVHKRTDKVSKSVAILLTDGQPFNARTAMRAAKRLKKEVELYCLGIGDNAREAYLMRMATSKRHYFHADSATQIPLQFSSITELFLTK
jgi:molecular chaperone DnaK (HSP70)/uncharacterized protein YegL